MSKDLDKPHSTSSDAWNFFHRSKDGKLVKCTCGKEYRYSNSTTCMLNHVKSRHEKENKQILRERRMRDNSSSSPSNHSCTSMKNIDEMLVLALSTSNVPFKFVKNGWFKKFCTLLNPNYRLMTPDMIARRLKNNIDSYVKKCEEEMLKMDKCLLAFDGWEPKFGTNLYAVFAYFINSDFQKKRILLGIRQLPEKATAENFGNLLTDLLKDYSIDISKVIGAICDAGSNLICFLDKNSLFHIHCMAHSLALILKKVSEVSTISKILEKVNSLAAHLSRSKLERNTFRERSRALKTTGRIPLPFCCTRWGGCVLLAESYLNHYQSIFSISRYQEFLLNTTEKETLEEFVRLTVPYTEAIAQAETDRSCCSEIIVQYAHLYNFVKSEPQGQHLVKCLTTETFERYTKFVQNDLTAFATYMDPRFVFLPGILLNREWEDVEKGVESYNDSYLILPNSATTFTPPAQKQQKIFESSFSKFVESKRLSVAPDSTKNEMVSYRSMIMSGRPDVDSCPLQFWDANKQRFPKLATFARHVLCAPQTSAEVERLFSRCGQIVSSTRRNTMTPQTMNAVLLNAALANLKNKQEKEEIEDSDSDEDDEEETGDDGEEKGDDEVKTVDDEVEKRDGEEEKERDEVFPESNESIESIEKDQDNEMQETPSSPSSSTSLN